MYGLFASFSSYTLAYGKPHRSFHPTMEVSPPEYRICCLVISVMLLPAPIFALSFRHVQQRCSVTDPHTCISIFQMFNDFALVTVASLLGRGLHKF